VANINGKTEFVDEFLKFNFPEAHTIAVAPADMVQSRAKKAHSSFTV